MYIKLLKSKIHRAIITETDLEYEGSITIDSSLMKDANLYTVALGINIVFMDDFANEWGSIAAASVIAATPIAVLFIFFQKQITGGLTAGSIKG